MSEETPGPEQAERELVAVSPRDAAVLAKAARMAALAGDYSHPPRRRRRVALPVVLFLATCVSTFWAGAAHWEPVTRLDSIERAATVLWHDWQEHSAAEAVAHAGAVLRLDGRRGTVYMAAVLAILLSHEMGHFLTARWHRIPASLPFFIPVPVLPFGTMGAVIALKGSLANRREIFDLGIAGPLAGLIVALPITWIGIQQLGPADASAPPLPLHTPLLFKLLIDYLRPDLPTNSVLYLNQFNPLLMAGWVGMLVTGLNMVPISQLDGGHVAYALLGRRAHTLARGLVVAAIVAILVWEAYPWVLMLVLVILMGVDHPPTAEDRIPLGWPRRLLGWSSLAIPILCFPPVRMV